MSENITVKHPAWDDCTRMWKLASKTTQLDNNSWYTYHLLTTRFSQTCAVASLEGELIGFVTGFKENENPGTLFIWQMAVEEKRRGQGTALDMLAWLVKQTSARRVCATVDPENRASLGVFQKLAESCGGTMTVEDYLKPEDFPEEGHPSEKLVTITLARDD